jgi:hypothetical protein
VNNSATNKGVQVYQLYPSFHLFGHILMSGIARSSGRLICRFLRNFHTDSHSDCTKLYSLPTVDKDSFPLASLPVFVAVCVIEDSHFEWSEMKS